MSNDTTVPFYDPAFRDELSDLVRDGAQRIFGQSSRGGEFTADFGLDRD